MKSVIIWVIRLYQRTLSPDHGWFKSSHHKTCRFSPTCSEYMIDAIRYHGIIAGVILGSRRILRCHPFHPGGYDPVPITRK